MPATLGEKLVTGDEEAPPAVAKPDDNATPTIAACRAAVFCSRRSRRCRVAERVAGASASRRHCIDLHNLLYT